jgi:hypothetical protein
MTMTSYEPLTCECGHRGRLKCRESDTPYGKPWEQYSLVDFEGEEQHFEGFCSDFAALLRPLRPKCPECGAVGRVRLGDRPAQAA